jgi:hypothetical protein
MGWLIRVGQLRKKGFEHDTNAGVITSNCSITSNDCRIVAQIGCNPNAGKTTYVIPGSDPGWRTQQVWQNVLSILVGMDD